MTVRELLRAWFGGAARRVRGPVTAPHPAPLVRLRREIPGTAAGAMPTAPPRAVPPSAARPCVPLSTASVPLSTAHIGRVPTASRVL
ncbi:hypothetical protein [Streptomyces triticiradicis]|uniref:Uncharacterized protein n=1 Tax=Streptomyces triticiradicis TaxID=2651189 RepID=A0A7J5D5T4_9ACTN|nr:hypothetical protein [Streptomyces triticiradicis]KAB1979431.1 hypothetical protein F8144_36050 [Streptomyces triticiradicis]